VPTKLINKLLKRYFEKGTNEFPKEANKSVKFCIVGFWTKKVGGKRKSSLRGLNAKFIVYIKGITIKAATRPNPKKIVIFPHKDRVLFRPILELILLNTTFFSIDN